MAAIDPSYIEVVRLVLRPFREEFEFPWNWVRTLLWAMLAFSIMAFLTWFILDPKPEYESSREAFKKITLWAGLFSLTLYGACGWHAYEIHLQSESLKSERLKKFRD